MTCTRFGNAIICHYPFARLHLKNKYVWMEFHSYCGPSFFTNYACTKHYVFTENCEDDPIWDLFEKWYAKYKVGRPHLP